MDNETWMLRSAWISEPSAINKLLREGFEPFWGYRIERIKKGEKKSDVRMYFRKAPIMEELQLAQVEPIKLEPMKFDLVPLAEFSNQFRSLLSGVLDQFTERFFERLAESEVIQIPDVTQPDHLLGKDALKQMDEFERRTVEVTEGTEKGNHNESRESPDLPAGDGFRPLTEREEIPVMSTANRTPQQDNTIESLKKKHGNVSILTGGEGGAIRVMVGADIYTIGLGGNFTVEETGANTSSAGF